MAINFKKYERTGNDLEIIGTVASTIGKGGSLKFVPGTFTSGKRIAVILSVKNGDSTVLACSNRVSTVMREGLKQGLTKKQLLAAISKLEISEDADDRNFIVSPVGVGGVEEAYTVESLKGEEVDFEELAAAF